MPHLDPNPAFAARLRAKAPHLAYVCLAVTALLSACGGDDDSSASTPPPPPPPAPVALTCDDTMKTAFKPDANTTVTLVKAFKAGDSLALSGTPATPTPPVATADVCMVKLTVGPGNPGPAGALSTSAGIGMEVWLPAADKWNKRIHLLALGGFGGNAGISSTTVISNASIASPPVQNLAMVEGAVSAVNDGGHADPAATGAYAMNPDGTINTTLWTDISTRATHEMAVKVKALASAYYLEPQKYAYLEGCSGGGRQGLSEAQNNPDDFDGIVAGAPSINQTRFFPADIWPGFVIQKDLGGVALTPAQMALASGSAVSACDSTLTGQHDGFISDPAQCSYDPTTDASVLCVANGGTNATASCLTPTQAQAFNKIWYGPTPDGSVPAPSADNGYNVFRPTNQLWWGEPRGTQIARALSFTLSKDQIALNLQNSFYAGPNFLNATGNGQDGWKTLTYAGFANNLYQGVALNPLFGDIDTNNPDLTAFRDKGGKMLTFHGYSDQLVAGGQSTIDYYTRAANVVGGFPAAQSFYRVFFVPGMGHCSGVGSENGTASPAANPPLLGLTQMYDTLTQWVEAGTEPSTITVSTPDTTMSRPLCMYPKKQTYLGGDVKAAASFACK